MAAGAQDGPPARKSVPIGNVIYCPPLSIINSPFLADTRRRSSSIRQQPTEKD